MLSFWHIAKVEGEYEHCFVEISTDGGATFDQLPESTYGGAGLYDMGSGSLAEGPAFDEDSYTEWGTSTELPDNSWWRKEYFDLTDYNTESNVVIRFRVVTDTYVNRAGWYIDDITIEALGAPAFYVNPLSITEDATTVMPASVDLTMGNSGSFPTGYSANVVYDEVDLYTEDFNSGLPGDWTVVNNGNNAVTWVDTTSSYNGYDFDGTRFMVADGYQGYAPQSNTMDDELISPVIDASAYIGGGLLLEFDQAFNANWDAGDTAWVYVYDGAQWVEIYKSGADDGELSWSENGIHKAYNVSAYANANFQIKFHYTEDDLGRGQYFAIDNIRLRASLSALGWLTIDGAEISGGVTLPDSDVFPSIIDVDMDATGLATGVYTADIEVTSSDPLNPSVTVPVTMNVVAGNTISGNITYDNVAMTALEGCTVELRDASDAVVGTVSTDAAGYYEFTGILDGNYTLVTSLGTTWTYVTDVADVNEVINHILGSPLTGVNFLAADVNADVTVDVTDLNEMINNILGTATGYPAATDWVFEVQNVTVSGSNVSQSFNGLQISDVDGSWSPTK
jgi:hypothetical protein